MSVEADAAPEPLRVLVAHNAYRQRGGEDGVVAAEIDLLRRHGHEVIELRRDNAELDSMGRVRLAADTLWSASTHAEVGRLVARHRPHVVHVHNTLPLLSPSLHWAASSAGLAVVQTLHNFRLACPQAMFLRDGVVCERCLGRVPWPAVVHGCYRGSRAQTAVVASMLVLHRAVGTWRRKVDRFIALSDFARQKMIEGGLDEERVVVKPNFVEAPRRADVERSGLLFVGRLAPEKGIATLAAAAAASEPRLVLRIAGDGPEAHRLRGVPGVASLGALAAEAVQGEMGRALALVVPSTWYECFPRVIVESFAAGLPVIASRIGSLAELVEEGETGLLCRPGDPLDLARAMQWAVAHPDRMAAMGANARGRYERRYTGQANHARLLEIYRDAMAERAEAA